MAKIVLAHKLKLDMEIDGKIDKSFVVTYRDLSRKQIKQLGKENKKVMDVFNKGQLLTKRADVLEGKLEALREIGNAEEVLKVSTKLEKIYDEQSVLEDNFEELGGVDKLLEAAKINFDISVGGKDKEALAQYTEDFSDFGVILEALKRDVKEQQGKH